VNLPNISIDYAIMEKAEKLFVVPADWGWDDVGSWLSIERIQKQDEKKNIVNGRGVILNGENNIIINKTNRVVAAAGIKDLVVVSTDRATLIINKNDVGDIKHLIRLAENMQE
jgi:mannose-1-phosphate guanylyltransferase